MAGKSKNTSSKNQTAMQRNLQRQQEGQRPSRHYCASDKCPTRDKPILIGELCPVVTAPKRRTLFYHKTCWSKA